MKLLVHIGLHKTGSTYVQHLLNNHHAALAGAGLWYDPQPHYPAHHAAAWRLLIGDGAPLAAMVLAARRAGCHTVILSSEDLEGALHDPRAPSAIAATARDCGISAVEWHVVLRAPGAVFPSLFAQLQHHIYVDSFQMFYDAMHRGHLFYDQPRPGEGVPYWYYCMDQARDLERLAQRVCDLGAHDVIAHDYQDGAPFPGWAMLPENARAVLTALPGAEARNARLPGEAVAKGYVARAFEAVPDVEQQKAMMEAFTDSLRASLDGVATYAPLIGERFAESHRAALARFMR
ncbi:MAG: hypothetical protein KGJ57_14285 [Sphingomonadales bacterium]|nr:hypothetical protein [Sphingomonadales bacterium]MDE2170571.1 hypothetical protein [Sphingomonadales bacterium]